MNTTLSNKDSQLLAEAYFTLSKKPATNSENPNYTGEPGEIQDDLHTGAPESDMGSVGDIIVNAKKVVPASIKVEGIDEHDAPKFTDAFASYAQFEDGTELNDEELETLTNSFPEEIIKVAHHTLIDHKSAQADSEF